MTFEQRPETTREMLRHLTQDVESIKSALLGDPNYNRKGLIHDVKKLQKENANSKKFQWTAGTTLTGMLMKWFYHIVEHF